MGDIDKAFEALKQVEGYVACAVGDAASGMALAYHSSVPAFNAETAAAVNAEVMKAKLRAMRALLLKDAIEDILITLGTQYHLIRPLKVRPTVFLYLAVDRARANLALARLRMADADTMIATV